MKPATVVTVMFLCLVALAHLMRVVLQVDMTVDVVVVPMWASVLAVLFVGGLAIWLWREAKA